MVEKRQNEFWSLQVWGGSRENLNSVLLLPKYFVLAHKTLLPFPYTFHGTFFTEYIADDNNKKVKYPHP